MTTDDKQQITIKLEVVYTIKDGKTIFDATEAAKELLTLAKEYGTATGHVAFGRQKFSLG